jgi:hypothetical protein
MVHEKLIDILKSDQEFSSQGNMFYQNNIFIERLLNEESYKI